MVVNNIETAAPPRWACSGGVIDNHTGHRSDGPAKDPVFVIKTGETHRHPSKTQAASTTNQQFQFQQTVQQFQFQP